MMLRPDDVGSPGYGVFTARSWTAEEKAATQADLVASDRAEEQVFLEEAGYIRGHEQALGVEAMVELEEPQAAALVVTYIHAFSSSQGAQTAFAHFEEDAEAQLQSEDVEGTQ